MRRPLPKTPEGWLQEILVAWEDAEETKPFAPLAGTKITDADLFHLAPLVCLKLRGRKLKGKEAKRVTEVALANYVVKTDPKSGIPGLATKPKMTFALCYVAAHLALDLVDEAQAAAILEYCEERLLDQKIYLSEAVDEIREKLARHRLAPRKFLWPSIIKQIKKRDGFDGHLETPIEEAIRAFLRPLDDATIRSLWKETEVGMCNENEADRYYADDLRHDIEMEILQQVMDMAWYEATGKWPKRPTRNPDDPDDEWD